RAPNSKHQKTGLHKRRLSCEELMGLSMEGIRKLAERPEPFDLPASTVTCDQAAQDWQEAEAWGPQQAEAKAPRPPPAHREPKLNRQTLTFIRDGADQGDRHRLLFSAAANLAEFGCPAELAHALLTEAALDCGLAPSEVRRQIECGLAHTGKGGSPNA